MRAASPTTPLPSTTAFSISISRNIASAIAFSLKIIVYMGDTNGILLSFDLSTQNELRTYLFSMQDFRNRRIDL